MCFCVFEQTAPHQPPVPLSRMWRGFQTQERPRPALAHSSRSVQGSVYHILYYIQEQYTAAIGLECFSLSLNLFFYCTVYVTYLAVKVTYPHILSLCHHFSPVIHLCENAISRNPIQPTLPHRKGNQLDMMLLSVQHAVNYY